MENCPKCGALNTKDAQFCSLCHEPFNSKKEIPEDKETNLSSETDNTSESEISVNLKPHSTPGFDILVNEGERSSDTETNEQITEVMAKQKPKKDNLSKKIVKNPKDSQAKITKKEKNTQEIVKKSKTQNITEWLFPSIIATIFAFLTSLVVPKEQISASLGLGKILLSALMFGLVVSSGGIVQRNLKNAITGWLLGLSSNFLAFNIIFFGSFVLMRININFYTKYFLGSEIIIVAATLSAAITFSVWLEIFEPKKALTLASFTLLISLLISWLLLSLKLPILPIIAFISWPASFYAAKLFKQQEKPSV